MKSAEKSLNPSLKRELLRSFEQVVADLKDLQESQLFLGDFFTESELDAFAKRLAIAYWLKKGRSYNNIKDNLKVSSATVAVVANIVEKEGVKLAMKKIEAEEWANKWSEKIKKF